MNGYLLVRSGGAPYGLPIDAVIEVADGATVVKLPSTGKGVRGVTQIRRRTMPVVSLHAVLRNEAPSAEFSGTVVLVETGAAVVAVEVDDAEEVVRDSGHPVPPGRNMPWALGIAEGRKELVPIVDLRVVKNRLDPADHGGSA
jgi:chemotaxis signal transduction protein